MNLTVVMMIIICFSVNHLAGPFDGNVSTGPVDPFMSNSQVS